MNSREHGHTNANIQIRRYSSIVICRMMTSSSRPRRLLDPFRFIFKNVHSFVILLNLILFKKGNFMQIYKKTIFTRNNESRYTLHHLII